MQGVRTVSDDEILDQLRRCPSPAYVTSEIAEFFDMSRQGIRNRLNELHEAGAIGKKQPNDGVIIWWTDVDEDRDCYESPEDWAVDAE
jgi:DNA-binding GntR family transcriptional regulator